MTTDSSGLKVALDVWWRIYGRTILASILLVTGSFGVAPSWGRPRILTGLALVALAWVPFLLRAVAYSVAGDVAVVAAAQAVHRRMPRGVVSYPVIEGIRAQIRDAQRCGCSTDLIEVAPGLLDGVSQLDGVEVRVNPERAEDTWAIYDATPRIVGTSDYRRLGGSP